MTANLTNRPRFLNNVPEGRRAWLTYRQYSQLCKLTDAAALADEDASVNLTLQDFLTRVAGLEMPLNIASGDLHKTAFTLRRRGYAVEQLSPAEYGALRVLFDGLERPEPDDMTLHPEGGHRRLYVHLTNQLGLDVEPGRGPVWRRARDLLAAYEAERSSAGETSLERADRVGLETRAMLETLLATVEADARPGVAAILAKHLSAYVLHPEP